MSVFSQWCRSAHRHFSPHRAKLSLGQVQEITAAGLGHNSYASFKLQDLPRLDVAAYALISAEAMVQRAAAFGITLDVDLCRDAVSDFRIRPSKEDWPRDVVVGEDMGWAIRNILQETNHPAGIEFALEIDAALDGITMLMGEAVGPLARADNEWHWRMSGTAYASKGQENYELQVHCDAMFPRLGRRLLSQCVVLSLHRDGMWGREEYDPIAEGRANSYFSSDSNL
jgi:hypothetical protein